AHGDGAGSDAVAANQVPQTGAQGAGHGQPGAAEATHAPVALVHSQCRCSEQTSRHSRAGGNPVFTTSLDARLRGHDEVADLVLFQPWPLHVAAHHARRILAPTFAGDFSWLFDSDLSARALLQTHMPRQRNLSAWKSLPLRTSMPLLQKRSPRRIRLPRH